MTDAEMTRLAAEAMGYQIDEWCSNTPHTSPSCVAIRAPTERGFAEFDPFHDKAQCFELITQFELSIVHQDGVWVAGQRGHLTGAQGSGNLNRSIVGAVAMIQAAKVKV